ncbi:hypothetical protein LTR05_000868 [Lithohypha guttulata]|uniref:NAD(P)-binding domain-containing protein n=1 Tax=Lithohypha guttulata TaxID=1690604 RepID=A0AAN7YJQ8_9EURO|nr:hypothetical protein LTR05_000868 [Lithohypha guttulata]
MKVLLTGTSGNLGSRVLQSILEHDLIPTSDLIISTTSPNKVSTLAKQKNIPIVQGDLTQPEQLQRSYADSGADILFLVSYPSPSVERWLHHKTAIEAAKASGCIKLIIYTSLMFGGKTGMQSVAGVQQAHIKTVEYLADSGMDYVVLRQGIYVESWWLYAGFQPYPIPKDNSDDIVFVIPEDGPVAWVTWDDLGEGTAKILAKLAKGDREYVGKTLNLTGSRATTITHVAQLLEESSGRKVEVKIVGKEAAKKFHLKDGKREEWLVESWVGWFDGLKNGECEVVDPLLGQILGRSPRGIEECARELFLPQEAQTKAWH